MADDYKIADIKFNIERANEIVRLAENRRYRFLEINLALATAFSFLLVYILDNFNDAGKLSMIICIAIYFLLTLENIIYNLKENRTKGIIKTLCSNRGWKHRRFLKKMNKVNDDTFKIDYKNQLINLHKYQKNYNKIGKDTRIMTLFGLCAFLATFLISIIINSFCETVILKHSDIIAIILPNIISLILIEVIIWYLILFKAKKKGEKTDFIEIEVPYGKEKEYKKVINEYVEKFKKKDLINSRK